MKDFRVSSPRPAHRSATGREKTGKKLSLRLFIQQSTISLYIMFVNKNHAFGGVLNEQPFTCKYSLSACFAGGFKELRLEASRVPRTAGQAVKKAGRQGLAQLHPLLIE